MSELGEWRAQNAAQFRDRRYIMGREDRNGVERADHYRSVRAFRGVIARKNTDVRGGFEYDRCGHAHTKPGSAKQCAEREARRRNREGEKEAANEQAST